MELDLATFTAAERATLLLRGLFVNAGYHRYRSARFEEYSLYRQYERFLADPQVITFTDLDGKLRAIKPDVTLSIAKNAQPAPGEVKKYYYTEQVCRPSRSGNAFETIDQMGLECIGAVSDTLQAEVVALALKSLEMFPIPGTLVLCHMGYVNGLLEALETPPAARPGILKMLRAKNPHGLFKATQQCGMSHASAQSLQALLSLRGPLDATIPKARTQCRNKAQQYALDELQTLLDTLGASASNIQLDMSAADEADYYNGVVFTGYLQSAPRAVLKGGRYDNLMQRFTSGAGAIGYALYLDELDRLPAAHPDTADECINIALPKGRLGEKAHDLLALAGYGVGDTKQSGRKLVLENTAARVRYFLVKPSDVAIYVEHGAADIGIVGKDILAESGADVFELWDTGLGVCSMCVAGPADFVDDESRALRVATKYTAIARAFFERIGRDIDIIKLNGSIELAPILGLADVIVDIVETGTTLRENHLRVLRSFMPISARLIANKSSYRFKQRAIAELLTKLKEVHLS